MSDKMVVMNCGTQGMNKFEMDGRTILEKKTFPPRVPIECSRKMGEALLKKYDNPNMKIFFRNPADPQHRIDIENLIYAGMPRGFRKSILPKANKQEDQDNDVSRATRKPKRKYVRRK